ARRVRQHDPALRQTLHPRHDDEVLVQHFEHVAPHQQQRQPLQVDRQRRRRQEEVPPEVGGRDLLKDAAVDHPRLADPGSPKHPRGATEKRAPPTTPPKPPAPPRPPSPRPPPPASTSAPRRPARNAPATTPNASATTTAVIVSSSVFGKTSISSSKTGFLRKN